MPYSWYFQNLNPLATTDIAEKLQYSIQYQGSLIPAIADIMPDSSIILMDCYFFVQKIFF
jgi:hypothetical protein